MKNSRRHYYILHIGLLALLLGRAWLLFKKPSPITSFVYHPYLENVWAFLRGQSGEEFLGDTGFRAGVFLFAKVIAGVFVLGMIWVFIYRKLSIRLNKWIAYWLFGILTFLAFCFFLAKSHQLVQFFEYAAQAGMPLFFFYYVCRNYHPQNHFWLKLAIAITFIAHGLYALGVYPQPGHFVDMMIQGFGMTEQTARSALKLAGILDVVFAIGIFIPNKRIFSVSVWYLIIWGVLTTFARLVANVDLELGWYSWQQWIPQSLVRFPHFCLPLFLWLEYQFSSRMKTD